MKKIKFSRGTGCESRDQSGYKERVGIQEVLKVEGLVYRSLIKEGYLKDVLETAKRGLDSK